MADRPPGARPGQNLELCGVSAAIHSELSSLCLRCFDPPKQPGSYTDECVVFAGRYFVDTDTGEIVGAQFARIPRSLRRVER